MACYTQEEIAEREGIGKATVNEICSEMAELPKANKPYAEHLVDFEIPLYNVWKYTETITIPCSKQFKELVDLVCRLTDRDISEFGHGARDIKDVFSMEPYLDRSLREVLYKKPPGRKEEKSQGL